MRDTIRRARLNNLLPEACKGGGLDDEEVRFLLGLTAGEDLERLFQAARDLRQAVFGSDVFLYGFIYFSTFCRNDCRFCLFRRSNRGHRRYRKTTEEVLDAASQLAASGVHLIDLTLGEDPEILGSGTSGAEGIAELAWTVRSATHGLPVMVSPGLAGQAALQRYAAAGVEWYACYQETHRRELFEQLRPGQSFDARWQAKLDAKRLGLLVEEGILCGVGERMQEIAESIAWMRKLDADQVRVMSFIPQSGTPMETHSAPDFRRELHVLAVLRLAFPDKLIPASLDVEGLDGLKRRLEAGANVVTSLIAPDAGMQGVANAGLDIGNARRTAAAVLPVLRSCGLNAAREEHFQLWMETRRRVTGCRVGAGASC
jgi:methylornithine synthase